jgi:hypothetical protein
MMKLIYINKDSIMTITKIVGALREDDGSSIVLL